MAWCAGKWTLRPERYAGFREIVSTSAACCCGKHDQDMNGAVTESAVKHCRNMRTFLLLSTLVVCNTLPGQSSARASNPMNVVPVDRLELRYPAPAGTKRIDAPMGSFARYLRQLPLKPAGSPVLLHTGSLKARQDVHDAVVDISTGAKDLQQCADAVMRLRAEHLFANSRHGDIAFDLTNGFRVPWNRWRSGERVRVTGNACTWVGGGTRDSSHEQLLRYLEFVFMYAGTLSLSKELKNCATEPLRGGDIFIRGGSPGHAVIVLDVVSGNDGRTHFLLGQSYMPAQDIHVLKNPKRTNGSAWYTLNEGSQLRTPEWTFEWSDRKRWADQPAEAPSSR